MKYCIDKNEFVVASDQIPVHMSQQNVANSIDNSYFSVNLVSAFWPKAETQTPEDRRHSLKGKLSPFPSCQLYIYIYVRQI